MNKQVPSTSNLSPQEKRELLERLLKEKAASRKPEAVTSSSVIQPIDRKTGPLPLSSGQQRILFLDEYEPGTPTYNIPISIRFKGPLDVQVLEASLAEIVRRHEPLRTMFRIENGQPIQEIVSAHSTALSVTDLSQVQEVGREAEMERLMLEEAKHPFDLKHDLKLRAVLLRLNIEDHVLVLTMHHISSDGWSVGVLLKEVAALYEAFAAGRPSPLPHLGVQYTDYVNWHQHWFPGEILERQLSYWKKQLDNAPALLELPTDRPRPAMQGYHGDRYPLSLSTGLTASLKSLSRQEGATLFMTLLAAFQTLLFRYTGQDDILIGSPIAGRNRSEIKDLIGLFINTIVIRGDLSNNPTFRELVKRVRQAALHAYEHADLPFEKLVEELQPVRSLSYTPLFQNMFVLQNTPLRAQNLTTTSFRELSTGTAKFDLYLSMIETEDRLFGELEYSTTLFDRETIARMVGHFEALLRDIVSQPDKHLSDFNILADTEREQILYAWNQTQMKFEPACIQQLFEAQALRNPEKTAVVFEGTQLTYQELNQRANQLAHYLQKLGVKPDTLVGLYMERSLDMIVGLLGILKAGGAYVPLDPAFPIDRLEFMLSDSQAPILLTQQKLSGQLATPQGMSIVCIDDDWQTIAGESSADLPPQAQPENLAYVIYTSGSTGKPKGVQLQHNGVVNFLTTMRQEPGLTDQDVLLSVTTLSFDISVLEIFLPLTTGAQVELVSRETAVDATQLMSALDKSGATIMQATPTTWRMLIESGWKGDDRLNVLCGGEALPPDLASQILERCGSLWNMYGPTETTVWSTLCKVQRGDHEISIGRPIGNTQCYILDARLQPVPVGVPGDFYIGGDGLARGYLNRPELTAEKFIHHPFSDKPGARLYKTGDLAKYKADGRIHFLGRSDHQIKIRGFRVELGEIEAVLVQHPSIREIVVIVREDVPGDKRLVGYPILHSGEKEPTTSELRSYAREKLPEYMIPSAFVFLSEYPLTPNKKIDRKRLPAPDQNRPDLAHQYVAPRDEVEESITNIFASVLKLERVGIDDNFFELGGHSLLATQVISRIRHELQIELPIRTLFEAPSPEGLAQIIIRKRVEQMDEDKLAELLSNLENLSPEEAKALLDSDQ